MKNSELKGKVRIWLKLFDKNGKVMFDSYSYKKSKIYRLLTSDRANKGIVRVVYGKHGENEAEFENPREGTEILRSFVETNLINYLYGK